MLITPSNRPLGIRLAERLNDDAECAITDQEQARYGAHRPRLANKQVQNDKQHHTFQQQFIQLRRVARQYAVLVQQRQQKDRRRRGPRPLRELGNSIAQGYRWSRGPTVHR